MELTFSLPELTTAATDALLALECLILMVWLWRTPAGEGWRRGLWCAVLGLLAVASLLGAIAHGLMLSAAVREALWKPLYLCLGVLVALFVVGAVADVWGNVFARRLVPWAVALGAVFFGLTELWDGAFLVFVAYEAAALISALAIYAWLAATGRLRGAAIIAVAIVVNLAAAGVQASSLALWLVVPFDHNGLFHLVQMVGDALLAWGLHRSLPEAARRSLRAGDGAVSGSRQAQHRSRPTGSGR